MKLENQVCSLDLAKRFNELGIKQESLWWWIEAPSGHNSILVNEECKDKYEKLGHQSIYSAFTVAELGDLLSTGFIIKRWVDTKKWYCFGWKSALFNEDMDREDEMYSKEADTMADTMAKMVIYLKEKGLDK